jgi:hypothetical protein
MNFLYYLGMNAFFSPSCDHSQWRRKKNIQKYHSQWIKYSIKFLTIHYYLKIQFWTLLIIWVVDQHCLHYKCWVKGWLGYPPMNTKNSLIRTQIHLCLHFFNDPPWISPFFLMSNEIILFQILCRHLKYLFFSFIKLRIIKLIQCGPCSIMAQNS